MTEVDFKLHSTKFKHKVISLIMTRSYFNFLIMLVLPAFQNCNLFICYLVQQTQPNEVFNYYLHSLVTSLSKEKNWNYKFYTYETLCIVAQSMFILVRPLHYSIQSASKYRLNWLLLQMLKGYVVRACKDYSKTISILLTKRKIVSCCG